MCWRTLDDLLYYLFCILSTLLEARRAESALTMIIQLCLLAESATASLQFDANGLIFAELAVQGLQSRMATQLLGDPLAKR
jgi:energy-converting hydrogenase Eha subunit B